MKTTTTTLQKLRAAALALVETETERDPVPLAIEKMCAARVGKPLTKRDVDALQQVFPGIRVYLDKEHGVEIEYFTDPQTERGPWDGEKAVWVEVFPDLINWPEERAEQERQKRKLVAAGVPRGYENRRSVRVRPWNIMQGNVGATRWPTVDELRAMNPGIYAGREERNAQRAETRETIVADAIDLAPVAVLVDEINERAGYLRDLMKTLPEEVRRVIRESMSVDIGKGDDD